MARRRGTPIFEKAKPRKGLAYTTRQFSILCDDIPLSQISLTELFNIMKKADERGDKEQKNKEAEQTERILKSDLGDLKDDSLKDLENKYK